MFNLAVQDLENTVQQLWPSGWHGVSRQGKLVTGGGREEVGEGRAEGLSAKGKTVGTLQLHSCWTL